MLDDSNTHSVQYTMALISGMCQTSNIKTLNENTSMISSGSTKIDKNGTCKKIKDCDDSLPHKARKMDSPEGIQQNSSSQRLGMNPSSHNKSYSQTEHQQDSELKTNKTTSLNNSSDRKAASSNRQTKNDGGELFVNLRRYSILTNN